MDEPRDGGPEGRDAPITPLSITKGSAPFTWASGSGTAGGTTDAKDITGDDVAQVYYSLVQVGTPTTAPSFTVQVQPAGSANWYSLATVTPALLAGTYQNVIEVPLSAGRVQIVYTAQAGGTSSTASFELGYVVAS